MKKEKNKFFTWIPGMIGLILMLILCYGIAIFWIVSPTVRSQKPDKILSAVFVFFTIFFPTAALIFSAERWFSVFEITEKGVKRSVFKIFMKREITWEEMQEIRLYSRVGGWVFFSKVSLKDMYYDNIVKRKDVIQTFFDRRIFRLIKKYTDKEIINLPEEFEKKGK